MNTLTKSLKQEILLKESIQERLEILKDKFADKKAVILAPGPSLNEYDL